MSFLFWLGLRRKLGLVKLDIVPSGFVTVMSIRVRSGMLARLTSCALKVCVEVAWKVWAKVSASSPLKRAPRTVKVNVFVLALSGLKLGSPLVADEGL